eukprot:GHVT01076598.1.p1 GENE.GHVT01076598.1~~GHVT01076598.1.p1  ORF type:complete len:994 (+),score=76.16 GHVT01076598.1:383-3364(+)
MEERVIQALETLYGSRDDVARKEADKWLRAWQKLPEAWEVADALLGMPSASAEVYCFGAQVLRSKIMYDFYELPESIHANLFDSLCRKLELHKDRGPTTTALCLALCDFSLQATTRWQTPVEDILKRFPVDSTHGTTAFSILRHLPEENLNARVMVDDHLRSEHAALIHKAMPAVLESLSSIHRSNLVPSVRRQVLACWQSWITFAARRQLSEPLSECNLVFVEECFKALSQTSDQAAVDSESGGVMLQDIAAEALEAVVSCCGFNQENDALPPSSSAAILNLCVKYCAGDLQPAISAAFAAQDTELLRPLSQVVAATCCALLDKFVQHGDRDLALQQLLHTVIRFTELPISMGNLSNSTEGYERTSPGQRGATGNQSADGSQSSHELMPIVPTDLTSSSPPLIEAYDDDTLAIVSPPLGLWLHLARFAERSQLCSKLAGACATASGASPGTSAQLPSADTADSQLGRPRRSAVVFLANVFDIVLGKAISMCIIPPALLVASPIGESALPHEYQRLRRKYAECAMDCSMVIGQSFSFKKIQDIIAKATQGEADDNRSATDRLRIIEACLVVAAAIIEDYTGEPEALPECYELLMFLELVLTHEPPMDVIGCHTRLAALHFLDEASAWSRVRPTLIPQVLVHFVMPQISACSTWTSPVGRGDSPALRGLLDKIVTSASLVFRLYCRRCNSSELADQLIGSLCQLNQHLDQSGCTEEVCTFVLEAVSGVAAQLTQLDKFLAVIESLCAPNLKVLADNVDNPAIIVARLDRIAIILREIHERGRADGARLSALSVFVSSTLWPMVRQLLSRYASNASVVERCGRCLKHAIRCTHEEFKPLIGEVAAAIKAAAQVELQSTHMYTTEVIAKEFAKMTDVHEQLADLFNFVLHLGLEKVDSFAKAQNLDNGADFIEDCYGMLCRYLNFCPVIAASSPHLETVSPKHTHALRSIYLSLRQIIQTKHTLLYSFTQSKNLRNHNIVSRVLITGYVCNFVAGI